MCDKYLLYPKDSKEIAEIIKKIEVKNQEVKTGEILPSNKVPLILDTADHDIDVETF